MIEVLEKIIGVWIQVFTLSLAAIIGMAALAGSIMDNERGKR